MRISDEERREVAAKMREICRENPDVSLQTMVASAMNECLPEGMEYGPTLADLIDRPTTTRHGKFKTKYGRQTPCCEVCGYSIGDMRWNHCPKCGAAITDD